MTTPLQIKTEQIYQKYKRREFFLFKMNRNDLQQNLPGLKLYKPQQTLHIANVERTLNQHRIQILLSRTKRPKMEQKGFISQVNKWVFQPLWKNQKENQCIVQGQKGYVSLPIQEKSCQRGPLKLIDDQ